MPKTKTSSMSSFLATQYGSEPIVLVEIDFPSGTQKYADKNVDDYVDSLVSVDSIRYQAKTVSIGEVATTNITLDDSDGSLKSIFDTDDVTNTVVRIYHSYEGVDESLLMMTGKVISHTWSEDKRQVTLNIESGTESREISHTFNDDSPVHDDAKGNTVPICFGTVLHVPAIAAVKSYKGSLQQLITYADSSFNVSGKFPQDDPVNIVIRNILFVGSFAGEVFTPTTKNAPYYTNVAFDDRNSSDDDYAENAVAWITDDAINLVGKYCIADIDGTDYVNLCVKQEGVKCYFAKEWPVGIDSGYTIDEVAGWPRTSWSDTYHHEGTMADEEFNLFEYVDAGIVPDNWSIQPGEDVRTWVDQTIYVCNAVESTEILGVYAYRTYRSIKSFTPVPSRYYTKQLSYAFDGTTVTALIFPKALSDITGEGWEDEVYVSLRSSVSNSVPSIIQYILETYTDVTIDNDTFDDVSALLTYYPANFAYFSNDDALAFIEKIAWQSRCAVSIRNGVAFIKYLPLRDETVPTINEALVIEQTLDLSHSTREDIVTKYTAKWKKDYSGRRDDYKVVYENNVDLYDLHESEEDFFIYTDYACVKASLYFWGYVKSNIWRIVSMQLLIEQIGLDVFDQFDVDIEDLSDNTIRAIISSVLYNSDDVVIGIEARLISKSGQDEYGAPSEDSAYWNILDGSSVDPGDGLSEVDYDPTNDSNFVDSSDDREITLKVVGPTHMYRNRTYTLYVYAIDGAGNIVNTTFKVDTKEAFTDNNDNSNLPSDFWITRGKYKKTGFQVTGGSGDQTATFTFIPSRANIPIVTWSTEVWDNDSNGKWRAPGDKVVRDQSYDISFRGYANTTYTLSIVSTDPDDTVVPLSFTTDAYGKWSGSFHVTGGSGDDDSGYLKATFMTSVNNTKRFKIVDPSTDDEEDNKPIDAVNIKNDGSSSLSQYDLAEIISYDGQTYSVREPVTNNLDAGLLVIVGKDVSAGNDSYGYVIDHVPRKAKIYGSYGVGVGSAGQVGKTLTKALKGVCVVGVIDSTYCYITVSNSDYKPFHVTKYDATTINVGRDRAATIGRRDIIYVNGFGIDSTTIVKTAVESLTISASAYIYYQVATDGSAATLVQSSTPLPASPSGYYYIPVAYVSFAGGAITDVYQYLHDHPVIWLPGGATSTVPVKVVSGSGATYSADVYGNGPTNSPTAVGVTLKILQIDSGEAIPADTWLFATLIGSTYYGQVPIWL